MKINQFGVIETTFEQKLFELKSIGFYDAAIKAAAQKGPVALFAALLQQAATTTAVTTNFSNYMVSEHQDLADFFANSMQLNVQEFDSVALQLLQFVENVDYTLAEAVKAAQTLGLPLADIEGDWSTDDVLTAWYSLLTTHTKNGLQFIDLLASHGYFKATNESLFFNGKAMVTFDTNNLKKEVVYVETDLDTDNDGIKDLVRVDIIRPTTKQLVPTLFTASPYYQGTNDVISDKKMHSVNVPLERKRPNRVTYDDIAYQEAPAKVLASHEATGEAMEATETFYPTSHVDLNNYFLSRGFAVAYSAGVGTRDSDGMQDTGSPDQVASMQAVVEWLAGNRRAFVDRTSGVTIKAQWSNGKVAMTGKSYLGTLATAVATTGVDGLETVISEAAISDWYQYYRDNGLAIAPGGFPGEDMDVLAELVYSRMQDAGDWHRTKEQWTQKQTEMAQAMDRVGGNYNTYWDARNYLKNVPNIKADVVMVHGLNDWNVKPRQVFRLFQKLQELNIVKKLYLHQGQHIYINNNRSLDFSDQMNLWLSYKLYDVDNQAVTQLPDITWQSNQQPDTWQTQASWGQVTPTAISLANVQTPVSYTDQQTKQAYVNYSQDYQTWRSLMMDRDKHELDHARIMFLQPQQAQDLLIDGEVSLQLRMKSSANVGLVSAMLVDYGKERRLTTKPVPQGEQIDRGQNWQPTSLMEFELAKATPFKMITIGHMNMQNRENPWHVDDLRPHEYVDLTLTLQPTLYQLTAGHQLGIVIYGTDFEMTVRGNQHITYTIDTKHSQLLVPVAQVTD
ncbi:Xaa-Pro dipeptidyl-peptidase [Weissella bombi]|uniref:Xaa-Pro dipeptidyl-peptidase n=1 Tax=Weissella bombi TaxID=1505725 RepID=A0A1C4ACT6_9LACO|nr:Xaa-Pro dipeptidyl-peptidase [Weissella bombi]SCB92370.1 dipeptidyl-peptidase IV . Serine peptidase. MEROPS family S15 [Weissella bombi]